MGGNPKTSKWRTTRNPERKRKNVTINLSDEARAKLERLAKGGHKSAVVERLINEAKED